MLPDYREGDVVVFSPARAVASGSDCFVRLEPDHESTFKRVFFEEAIEGAKEGKSEGVGDRAWGASERESCVSGNGAKKRELEGAERGEAEGEGVWVRLQPLNPRFAARVVERERVAGCYAAVCVIRRISTEVGSGETNGRRGADARATGRGSMRKRRESGASAALRLDGSSHL